MSGWGKKHAANKQKKQVLTFTCGWVDWSWRWRASFSFSMSWSFDWVWTCWSWDSRRASINLSLSSSMFTISCSKLASSPDSWDSRSVDPSSEIVGITSHIILKDFYLEKLLEKITYLMRQLTNFFGRPNSSIKFTLMTYLCCFIFDGSDEYSLQFSSPLHNVTDLIEKWSFIHP